MKELLPLLIITFAASAITIYDDFSGGIAGWEERCLPATWYASMGLAWCQTSSHCSALVFPDQVITQDGVITAYGSGNHTFGVAARLDSDDSGVCAYLSIDANLARIRRVTNGTIGQVFTTLSTDFPVGDYMIVFSCVGENMTFTIEHVQTSQTWVLHGYSSTDVKEGEWGLLAGQTTAWWDWAELQYDETGTEGQSHDAIPAPAIIPDRNPFSGSVIISVQGIPSEGFIDVYDISGRMVQSLDVSSGSGLFAPPAAGVYLARLAGGSGMPPIRLVCLP